MKLRHQKRKRSLNRTGDSPAAKKLAHDEDIINDDTDSNSEFSFAEPALSDSSSTEDSIEDETPNSDKKQDAFCWTCHKACKSKLKCSTCPILFHGKCVPKTNTKSSKKFGAGWKCPECETIAQNRDNDMEMNSDVTITNLLQTAMERIAREHDALDVPSDYLANDLLVNPVTFEQIIDNVTNGTYANTDEFLLDFKWMNHNFNILAGRDDDKDPADLKKEVKRMMNACMAEIEDIRNCCDCYSNLHDSKAVVKACSKPHIVLWVKYGAFPWWPAKLLKIDKGNYPIEVRFFGDFSSGCVTYTDCYLYSNEDPNVWCGDTKKADFYEAIKEVNIYIENVKRRFGPFHVAPSKSKLVPGNLKRYLDDMIPGYQDRSKRANIHQDGLANGHSISTPNAENGLEQSRPEIRIKQERIDQMDESFDNSDEQTEPDLSNVQTDMEQPRNDGDVQAVIIAEQTVLIEKLQEELRAKNGELETQRRHWQQLLQEAHMDLISKVNDAKRRLWCIDCNDMLEESPTRTCKVCSLFQ